MVLYDAISIWEKLGDKRHLRPQEIMDSHVNST